MGHPWFGSKATSGLCQALVALMPPHAVYIETHLGGGAVMRRKPAALRSIGIDLDARALSGFECGYPVELVHGDCHGYLSEFAFDGHGAGVQRSALPAWHAQVRAPLPARLRGRRPTRRCSGCSRGCRAR